MRKLPEWARARLTPGFWIFCSLTAITIAISAVGFIFAGLHDSDQVKIEQQIVRSATKDALAKLGDSLRNNTYWDTAYDQITDEPDPKWTEQNLGPYAHETTGVSALFVFGDDDKLIYHYVAPEQKTDDIEFETDAALITLVKQARTKHSVPPSLALGFVGVGDKVYLGAASLIVPNDDRAKNPLARHNVEIYLTEFDSSKISKVQTDFHLSGVSLVSSLPKNTIAHTTLDDAAGTTVSYITWQPSTPGTDLAFSVAPYALVCIAVIGLFQWLGLTNWIATARLLEQTKSEATKLREESWSKTMFLANMSHELRTPLNAIIGFSDLMTNQLFGPIPERYRSYVGDINHSGRHLLDIVNDVLDLTKLQNSGAGLQLEPVSLPNALQATRNVLEGLASEGMVVLEFAIGTDERPVMTNTKALSQILLNLGSNAIKFSEAKSLVRIAISHEPRSQEIIIDVADHGCGIPEEKLSYLGQPFYQTNSAYSRKQGTGLGLALVRALVTRMDGTFTIQSVIGVGTIVKVTLPAVPYKADQPLRVLAA